MEELLKKLQQEFKFKEETITDIFNHFEKLELKKGDFLLKEGQVCHYNYCIVKGLVMYYQLHDGNIVPCDFASEGNWITYLKSFSTGNPSDMFIVTLEASEIYRISKTSLGTISDKYPKIFQIQNHYTQESFMQNTEHAANLAKLSAKERYLHLQKAHSDWIQRVPQYYIASYLGIKPQSLSRIKKELSK